MDRPRSGECPRIGSAALVADGLHARTDGFTSLAAEPGVLTVRNVRMRWIGHQLHAEADLSIDPGITLDQAHHLAHEAEHTLTHTVPKLRAALVHAYPA